MNHDDQPEFLQAYPILCNEGLSPLTTITGYAQLALQGVFGPLTPEQSNAFTVIVQQTKLAMQTWRQGLDYLRATYHEIALEWQPFAGLIEQIKTQIQPTIPNLMLTTTIDPNITVRCDVLLLGSAIAHLIAPMELVRNHTSQRVPSIHFHSPMNATIDCDIQSLATPEATSDHLDYLIQLPGLSLNVANRIIRKHESMLMIRSGSDGIDMHFTLTTQ